MEQDALILVRGGGDLATGTIHRLWSAGFRVLVLEAEHPAAIRRQVALCEAVYEGETTVEGLRAVRVDSLEQSEAVWTEDAVPVLVDPFSESIRIAKPEVVVDAILAKKNLGTTREMAPLTIALGPGFTAGEDVDVVIETKRGHRLGRVIREGTAIPNTGIPGVIAGFGKERVIHSPAAGIMHNLSQIGDIVEKDCTDPDTERDERSCHNADHRDPAWTSAQRISGNTRFQGRGRRPAQRGTCQLFFDF